MDSRVLLDLLARYKNETVDVDCLAVHVHHGLSENADKWSEYCAVWCKKYGIKLIVERVELNLVNQVSIEQEARIQRYRALEKHVGNNDILLTAQHGDDQLETFLLALKRGSGPKGLSSMPECARFSKGWLLRPFLTVNQHVILEYAQAKQLQWVDDESNQDIQYDRNFLRHEVIPKLKGRWPSIEQAVLRSCKLCADQESLIHELLHERLARFTDINGGLSITELSGQSALAKNQLIRLWLNNQKSMMPSLTQLNVIWNEVALAKPDGNPIINTTSGQIRRFKDRLYFVGKLTDVTSWTSSISLNESVLLPDTLGCLHFVAKRDCGSLSLRQPTKMESMWVHFNPQGMNAHPAEREHSRKLKKLFQEYQVPSWLRTRTPIVMYGDKLAMVVGLFVSKDCQGDDCEIIWDKV